MSDDTVIYVQLPGEFSSSERHGIFKAWAHDRDPLDGYRQGQAPLWLGWELRRVIAALGEKFDTGVGKWIYNNKPRITKYFEALNCERGHCIVENVMSWKATHCQDSMMPPTCLRSEYQITTPGLLALLVGSWMTKKSGAGKTQAGKVLKAFLDLYVDGDAADSSVLEFNGHCTRAAATGSCQLYHQDNRDMRVHLKGCLENMGQYAGKDCGSKSKWGARLTDAIAMLIQRAFNSSHLCASVQEVFMEAWAEPNVTRMAAFRAARYLVARLWRNVGVIHATAHVEGGGLAGGAPARPPRAGAGAAAGVAAGAAAGAAAGTAASGRAGTIVRLAMYAATHKVSDLQVSTATCTLPRTFVQRLDEACAHGGADDTSNSSEDEEDGGKAERVSKRGRVHEGVPLGANEAAREAVERDMLTQVEQLTPAEIAEGAKQIYQALDGKYVDINNRKQKVNGDMTKVRHVPTLGKAAHKLLTHIEHTSRRLSGTQEARRVMRFETNALRVRYGVPIFVTFSPDEGHNLLMVRLSRTRRQDPVHKAADDEAQSRLAGGRGWPRVAPDMEGLQMDLPMAAGEAEVPPWNERRRILARDPMASVDGFRILVDAALQELDWEAIEREFMPSGRCAVCGCTKYKNMYPTVGQWSRADGLRVCSVCLEDKKRAGTPWQCMECGLWKCQEAFHASQHHPSKLTTRRCVDCPERRSCRVCEDRKYEQAFAAFQWDKAGNARCKGGMCLECEELKKHLTCSRCGQQKLPVEFAKAEQVNDEPTCKACKKSQREKDMKTCAVCEKAQRQDCFSDWMWNGVADLHRKCKRCVAAPKKDMKTCAVCEKAHRQDWFSDWMWNGVADLHRKCKQCVAAGRKEVRTCVAREKAQQKDCFSEKMWDGRAEQHRKCKRCIDDAKLQRGKWKCVECKGAFGRDEYSSWLAGRTTQKADGKQRCNECCAGQERKRKEVAERSHASVTKVRKTG
ncbi:unnamed protein product [Prorocentrum cordatum]|uniref:Uncharacterized protein n=1 Tax=Prorocentrum cordatum TaxID=2364126 RepID=A0ABN9TMR1_9DINO|nr:unnamed protein product [Polarella glacialis]